ncbi:hypothetical protein EK0264_00515 [Epidermidibacterium keratini]|uniref:DUF1542 domain-containing protein n=1 Tax=Epidermidibacterium keratini TaxID=1891644 RepID=A0A7L4YK61_9ACTN|nr:hypothetical protein [Epidermidibacterium keratini]QHB98926.1 hypothetical protein EK0264_00515 [Epidermidibacterium keratini]
MDLLTLLLLIVVGGLIYMAVTRSRGSVGAGPGGRGLSLEDSKADARRWIERLGGQVMNLDGTDAASKQALADASERFTAAGSQIEQATTPHQAQLAKDTALEGLYYVRAAREAMGLDPGPELPRDSERERAGAVTEDRRVDVNGEEYELSPNPSDATPHYYPGGRVAGRPVPRGWYSTPWWQPALVSGVWAMSSMLMFSMMFSGMAGVASAAAWEQGYDAGQEDAGADGGDDGDAGADGGDAGDAGGDAGGDWGGDWSDGGAFGSDGGGFGDFGGGFDF